MKYAILEDSTAIIVLNEVDKKAFPLAVEAPDDIIVGDKLIDGEWVRMPRPEPEPLASAEQRQQAYTEMTHKEDGTPIIEWGGEAITVDAAVDLWTKYSAEGSAIAMELQELIASAKDYIRELYSDENA